MDTTQKPREPRRQAPAVSGEAKRPRPAQPPARSAGAAKTGERPRRTSAASEQEKQTERPAARQRAAAQQQQARPERPAVREPSAARETPAAKQAPAAQKRSAEKGRPAAKERSTGKDKSEAKKKQQKPKKSLFSRKPAQKKRPAVEEEDISNKKRSYGKSKPKKKSAFASAMEGVQNATKKRAEKKAHSGRPKQPTPAIIYTQPAAFNRDRLIIQLVTVTAVVLALVIGLSVFFKVEHIYVSGAKVYSESSITEVCGINTGDNLLTFSHARAAALIQANRPYVREVRFGIKLPDTVNIIIEEDDVVYAIKDQTGQWWLMNSTGRVVEQGNNAKVANHTQVLGVALDNPVPNEMAVALESAPAAVEVTTPEGETVESSVPVTTTGAQRLSAVLQMLKALEVNDIVGNAASVDVSRIDDIILWYGTRYQVNLGDSTRLDYKIACMNSVIAKMSEYQSGILDISFTIWPNQVGYTPFS